MNSLSLIYLAVFKGIQVARRSMNEIAGMQLLSMNEIAGMQL
jgi:hypothetical protein